MVRTPVHIFTQFRMRYPLATKAPKELVFWRTGV